MSNSVNNPPRAAYAKPILTVYGDVSALTASGSGTRTESANEQSPRRRP